MESAKLLSRYLQYATPIERKILKHPCRDSVFLTGRNFIKKIIRSRMVVAKIKLHMLKPSREKK